MPKGFRPAEKQVITQTLLAACKASWRAYGYKKTSLDTLCQQAGISKGAFYVFFDSKEALFYQVLLDTQRQLYQQVEDCLAQNPSKQGVCEALKAIYREYRGGGFLYDTKSGDFQSFLNKLSEEQRQELTGASYIGAKQMVEKPFLTLKVGEEMALSLLSVLLASASHQENLLCDPEEVFGFLIDHLIDSIFE